MDLCLLGSGHICFYFIETQYKIFPILSQTALRLAFTLILYKAFTTETVKRFYLCSSECWDLIKSLLPFSPLSPWTKKGWIDWILRFHVTLLSLVLSILYVISTLGFRLFTEYLQYLLGYILFEMFSLLFYVAHDLYCQTNIRS